jgi:hypothetical protein
MGGLQSAIYGKATSSFRAAKFVIALNCELVVFYFVYIRRCFRQPSSTVADEEIRMRADSLPFSEQAVQPGRARIVNFPRFYPKFAG